MPFDEFLKDWELEKLLEDADANDYDCVQLVTQALWRFCITDGKLNNFQVGRLTILQFQ
jgi:hypothetical protein